MCSINKEKAKREKRNAYFKQWRKARSEKKAHRKKCYQKYKEKIKADRRKHYQDNLEKEKAYSKQYGKQHREAKSKKRRVRKRWEIANHEKINQRQRLRYRTDLKFQLSHKMRAVMYRSLKSNEAGKHWETIVGYTIDDLINRLKKTMPKGYSWQDYLQGKLHIDHIIPISAFNYTKPEDIDFKGCWALDNLRLLPAKANLKKSNKLERPFQLSLTT